MLAQRPELPALFNLVTASLSALIAGGLLAACQLPNVGVPVERNKMNTPTLGSGIGAVGYISPFASSLRNSRVGVPNRRYSQIRSATPQNCAEEDPAPTLFGGEDFVPNFVLVSPDTRHVVVNAPNRIYSMRTSDNTCLLSQTKPTTPPVVWVDNYGFMIGFGYSSWDGKKLREVSPSGADWKRVFRKEENKSILIFECRDTVMDEYDDLLFGIEGFVGSWHTSEQYGIGAISTDWHTVLVLDNGDLQVHGPEYTDRGPLLYVKRSLGLRAAHLSLAPPLIVVLSYENDGTRVLGLDGLGVEQWSVFVNIKAEQPAIDGGNGRLFIAGNGLAALQDGSVLWSHPDPNVTKATAFEDGALAVSAGPELRLMTRDGTIKQVFRTEDNEPIETPPAIASDGSIWVASAKQLYVLR